MLVEWICLENFLWKRLRATSTSNLTNEIAVCQQIVMIIKASERWTLTELLKQRVNLIMCTYYVQCAPEVCVCVVCEMKQYLEIKAWIVSLVIRSVPIDWL